jgi:PAS domain S-box-containing protein
MSIRRAVYLQIGLIALLVAMANGVTLYSIADLTSHNQYLIQHSAPALAALGQVKAYGLGLSEASLAVLSATQSHSPSQGLIEGELEEFESRQADLFIWLERYLQVAANAVNDVPVHATDLQTAIEQLHRLALQQVTDSLASTVSSEALGTLRTIFEEAEEDFEMQVNAAIRIEEQAYITDTSRIEAQASRVQGVSWITLLVIPTFAAAFAVRLAQSIIQPIRKLTQAAERIGDGDIQTHISLKGNNEFGLLASSLNSMIDRLRQTMVSRDYFEAIFHSVPNSLIIVHPDHRIERANRFTRTLLGYTSEAALVGKSFLDILSESRLNDIELNSTRRFTEMHYRTSDGQMIPVNLRKSVAINRHGGEDAIIYSAVDMTELKRLQAEEREKEALTLELARSRQLEDYKRRFVAMLSHEFRTPLSIINASIYLVERHVDKLTPEMRAEHFTRINDQILRLRDMMDDITTVMKAEYELIPFNPEQLDLAAICLKIVADLKASLGEKHVFITEIDPQIEPLLVDKSLLTRIVTNLLTNAVKYSPAGSPIHFNLLQQADEVMMIVKDAGIGIPKEDQQFVFQPYFRGANVTTITGTGLGLRIVQEAVRLHGGEITFESVHNLGTTFRVILPRKQVDYA